MAIGLLISSDNFDGLIGNITFTPIGSSPISLGEQLLPYEYLNPNYYGTYNIYIPLYDTSCVLNVPPPTPTPTITSTQTPTPTITSTQTPTPTITQTPF